MRIEFGRKIEKYIKAKFYRLFLQRDDFTIIANNCWGTFIYKQFGIPYKTPFVNLMLFAPDYINMLENFSLEMLERLEFIDQKESKHKDELIRLGIFNGDYPVGLLDGKYELHFLHYRSVEDAKEKWYRRLKRINPKRVIFKFSDGDKFEPEMAERFEALPFKNKILFSAKEFPQLQSVVTLEKFKGEERVYDEWKNAKKEFDVIKYLNNLKEEDTFDA
jgi:uncharacterized protein (DUF1919 family)